MFSNKLPPRDNEPGGFFGSLPDNGPSDPFSNPHTQQQPNPFDPVTPGPNQNSHNYRAPWRMTWHSWTGIICLILAVLIVVFMITMPLNEMGLADGASSLLGAGGTVITGLFAWVAVGLVGLIATLVGLFFVVSRKVSAVVLVTALVVAGFSVAAMQNSTRSVVYRAQQEVQQLVLTNFDLDSLTPAAVDQLVDELEALNLDDKGLEIISEENWERIPPEVRTYLENELQDRFQ